VNESKKREGIPFPLFHRMPPPPTTLALAPYGRALDLAGPFAPPPRITTATKLTYADGAVYEVHEGEAEKDGEEGRGYVEKERNRYPFSLSLSPCLLGRHPGRPPPRPRLADHPGRGHLHRHLALE